MGPYPWVEGRTYEGSDADIAAAGDLLGRIHSRTDYFDAAMPAFKWPEHDDAAVEKDVEDLTGVLERRAPEIARQVVARTGAWHRAFMTDTLHADRDGALPCVVATTDFRANNLVYTGTGPVLIDPDNADYLPRILDLAIAALLFHNGLATAPPRLFTQAEWNAPTALKYIASEWGTWTLVAADKWDDWADPHKRAFLADLAAADPARFTSITP